MRMRKYKIILINLCNLFLEKFNRSACEYYQMLVGKRNMAWFQIDGWSIDVKRRSV